MEEMFSQKQYDKRFRTFQGQGSSQKKPWRNWESSEELTQEPGWTERWETRLNVDRVQYFGLYSKGKQKSAKGFKQIKKIRLDQITSEFGDMYPVYLTIPW